MLSWYAYNVDLQLYGKDMAREWVDENTDIPSSSLEASKLSTPISQVAARALLFELYGSYLLTPDSQFCCPWPWYLTVLQVGLRPTSVLRV